ncbi:MAG: 4Fe-4S binding protein [Candidatus Hydrogenedentes bacterium]|nr:4Fe-4S binding protein [Candidatus Hydrogenedentota bacterium]
MEEKSVLCRLPLDLASARVARGRVFIIPERCKGCRYCVAFCPVDVLEESTEINAKGYHYPKVKKGKENACVHCLFCDLVCPEMAIYTEEVTA